MDREELLRQARERNVPYYIAELKRMGHPYPNETRTLEDMSDHEYWLLDNMYRYYRSLELAPKYGINTDGLTDYFNTPYCEVEGLILEIEVETGMV